MSEKRCDVCGAPMLHTNNEMCKNYHLQKEPMTSSSEQPPKEPTCTTKCPAIRDDKGSWYCRIMRACVAPSEHHFDYGFDIIKGGKITHSGYSTPCNAMALFGPRQHPAPATNGFIPLSFMTMHRSQLFTASDVCALIERHREEAARKAREESQEVLTLLEETVDNWWRTYNSLDFDYYRRTKSGEKGLKHHHNMRTHIYKKYKMFFDCCKTPEGIKRMQEFNRKAKEHIFRMQQTGNSLRSTTPHTEQEQPR